ncbi:MAG TPA: maltotransferase domain-containing protein, partial [Acidimicrobiales bacterium]|nr:maltotransferase domain-containing protein [Acidimicrobiales bacterium]
MLQRIVIDDIRPRTPSGEHPPKTSVGERTLVSADIFKDGHDVLAARVRVAPRAKGRPRWAATPLVPVGNDRWEAAVTIDAVGPHQLVIDAWQDRFATWRRDLQTKAGARQDVGTELVEGVALLQRLVPHVPQVRRAMVADAAESVANGTCSLEVRLNAGLDDALAAALAGVALPDDVVSSPPQVLWVDRQRARFSSWYELFPRSEGGFTGTAKRLRAVAEMGFDVLYLPPIHPIGRAFRKGPNNTLSAGPDDIGSPWAIGGPEGGHTEIHPDLGTIEDLRDLVAEARAHGMEVALDYALQCSPDHPWVRDHPEWFHHRPDGTIKYAENPPKRYQDIYNVDFACADWRGLWQALADVVRTWVERGVRVFRVDNPHTKPLAFWEWVIPEVQKTHPDTLFLAEAFTRPKMMAKLAEVGFSQGYTYFTWRNTRDEFVEYLTELIQGPTADYMR